MTQRSSQERVTALEKEVAELKRSGANGKQPMDWRSVVGMFGDDEGMKRIFENALAYREKDRARARRRPGSKRRAKK